MATETVETPIPDDLLAQALFNSTERSPIDVALSEDVPTEPETPATDVEKEPDPDAPLDAEDVPKGDAETPLPPPDATSHTDPLAELVKAGQPLTYTVDGQQKQYPGIFEVPGKGAVIPPDHLNRVRDTIQRAEHASEQNRKLYAENQEFQSVGGVDRMQKLETELAAEKAVGDLFAQMLQRPTELLALFEKQADGSVGFNAERFSFLKDRLRVTAERASLDAERQWQTQRTTHASASTEGTQRQAVLESQIVTLGKDLPSEDVEEAKDHVAQFGDSLFRKATTEDVQRWPGQGFAVGQTILDTTKMARWFESRRTLRATQVTTTTARAKAEAENAKRVPAKAVIPPKAKARPRNADGTFTEAPKKKYDREDFQRAALRGEPTPGTSDDE